jgi:hypothetical protein
MQIFYTNINTRGENSVTQSERKEMQNSLVDYGALHHTPVQGPSAIQDHPVSSVRPGGRVELDVMKSRELSPPKIAQSPPKLSLSPPPNGPYDRIAIHSIQSQHDFHLAGLDVFDTNFPINDAEIEAVIFNSTQDFWANFPGEVEMY